MCLIRFLYSNFFPPKRNQSERVFFNDYEDAGDLVFVPDPLDEIVVYSPKRKYQRKEGKSQNKACRRLSFEEQKKKPKKGDVKRQGTMGKRKKNHAVYATVNVKNYKKLITKELYVQLKRCDIDTFKYPLDFENKKLYIKVKRCDEDKKLKNIYISALRNFEMNNV
ncbi:hypothetical protein TNCT_467001 [Trichonephila clavata]|uniref:Uncharacterized protein n=1 Tax=Trichonephila clavata TaxID=2740835 RepID=A0A8X6GW43_TRICU|nr:hypothetical protein TNCT_467001 [Trichonephila clavata]